MSRKTRWITVAALSLIAAQASAQNGKSVGIEAASAAEAARAEEAMRAAEAREADVAQKMEDAERRMAQAAREIAELSSGRLPKLREFERRVEMMTSERPRLGVTVGSRRQNGPVEGVEVQAVTPGSAAEDAGLRAGDVLTAVNGEKLSADSADVATKRLLDFMDGVEEGDVLDVEYLRAGKAGTVEVEPRQVEVHAWSFGVPGELSMPHGVPDVPVAPDVTAAIPGHFAMSWFGNAWGDMELVELNEGLGRYFGTDSGVLVVSAPSSDALQLEDGDVIRKIDGREPTSVRHAIRILNSYAPGESLELEIMRDKRSRTLKLEMPDDLSSGMMVTPEAAPAADPAPPAPASKPALPTERT